MKIKDILLPVISSALILTACGDQNAYDDVLPEAGKIEFGNSETLTDFLETVTSETTVPLSVSETEETELKTETETDTDTETVTEIKTETETTITAADETAKNTETAVSYTETATFSQQETKPVITEKEKAADFSGESAAKIIYGGKCISPAGISDVKKFFGKPSVPEVTAPSCMGDGEDVVYTYPDFTVSVFVSSDGKAVVTSVISTGTTIGNPKGITVGMSESEALDIFGGYTYEEGKVTVSFFSENGAVTEVDYLIAV